MGSLLVPVFLAFFIAQVAIETALLLLNLRRAARGRGVPPALAGHVAPETAERSRAYVVANGRLALVQGVLWAALTLVALFSGVLPSLDRALAARGLEGAHRFVLFLGLLAAASGLLALPFSAWRTFVLEERFGFNRTSLGLWVVDRLKSLALQTLIGIPFLYAVYGFMRFTGAHWWVWLFGFMTAFQVLMLWAWPTLIAPLFNEFQPLPDGPLRERLLALSDRAGFRNRGLFVVDASRRSGHSNAYFAGLIRPRIVLFDTLVSAMSLDEAASVLAHEIGHYRRHHVHRGLAVSLAATLLLLFVLSRLVPWPPLYGAFGFDGPSLHAAVALLALGGGAFVFWLAPLASLLSRRHEYEADRYAVEVAAAPEALKLALVRLSGENLSNPDPHPWYSAWHYSHPALGERLAAIDRASGAAERRRAAGAMTRTGPGQPAAGAS